MDDRARRHATTAAAAAIVVASLTAHVYLLDALPRGFYVDESSIGYNAHLIAQSGRDEHGDPGPPGPNTWYAARRF